MQSFTFQSGDIQINLNAREINKRLQFTFQSGDIQIGAGKFKLVAKNLFTFQSGDIQMKPYLMQKDTTQSNLHSNLVIFKSETHIKNIDKSNIYIPIW